MSKHMNKENLKAYKKKKPFYKKVWFWFLIILIALLVTFYVIGTMTKEDEPIAETAVYQSQSSSADQPVTFDVPDEVKNVAEGLSDTFKEPSELVVERMEYSYGTVNGIQMNNDTSDESLIAIINDDGSVNNYQYNGSNTSSLGSFIIAIDGISKVDMAVMEDITNHTESFEQDYSTDLYDYTFKYNIEDPLHDFYMTATKK